LSLGYGQQPLVMLLVHTDDDWPPYTHTRIDEPVVELQQIQASCLQGV